MKCLLMGAADACRIQVTASGAEDLDDQLAIARPVELEQEEALPAAEIQPSTADRDILAGADEQMLAVSVAVGTLVGVHLPGPAAEVVVLVQAGGGRQPLEHGAHVLQQERLVLVENDGRRGVLREDRGPALRDPGAA